MTIEVKLRVQVKDNATRVEGGVMGAGSPVEVLALIGVMEEVKLRLIRISEQQQQEQHEEDDER